MDANNLDFKIVRAVSGGNNMQTDLIILFLLEGEMNVRCYGDKMRMKKNDILLINPGMEYEISGIQDAIYGIASYSISIISMVMGKKSLTLYVNSVKDYQHSYQDIRDILQEMTAEQILHVHQTRAAMDSLMFKLLDCLIENYQLGQGQIEADASDSDVRMRQMMQYIIKNIHDDISLSDLANEMFVSTSTLSRIFKKNTGMYFAEYVMRLRVRSALGLLRNSDQNLTQIAMNCGFSTSAAFNRSFKKVTGMMPSEYRKMYKLSDEAEEKERRNGVEIQEELLKKGYQYNQKNERVEVELPLNEFKSFTFKQVWQECINVGSLYELSRANTQFHVLHLQENLHFKYVRAWNIFSVKLMVSDGVTLGQYNFDLINQVLDFLVTHRIKPYLDIGRRPDTAIRTQGNEVYYREEYIPFASREIWEDLFTAFLKEITVRYGIEEVSTWIFELTRDFHVNEVRIYEDENYSFFNVWEFAYKQIHELVPGAMLGGISAEIVSDSEFVEGFLKKCVEHQLRPDFVSFLLYPYKYSGEVRGEEPVRIAATGRSFEENIVVQMRQLMDNVGLKDSKLYLSEWNNSIGNRNFLNDSCFRAAYLVTKAVELWSMTDMMAVMSGTDWVSNYLDTNKILNGGIGLLTKDTIRKPAFYALSFLGRMGSRFLTKGKNYLLTQKGHGGLYLLCFNFSWFTQDALMEDDEVDLMKIRKIRYEDERVLEMRFLFSGMEKEAEYTVKKRMISKNSGSILDEWEKLGFETKLNRDDIKYLQAVSMPHIEMERVTTDSLAQLGVKVSLLPQEVALLHIYRS